jgi:Raf kinase inhibitor-like YbhB/YbcL family protein
MSISIRRRVCRWWLLSVALCGCGGGGSTPTGGEKEGVPMKLTSPAFAEGDKIPKKFTADGGDVSPALRWEDAPAGTKSVALICDDPDAPVGLWVHWVLFNLPGDTKELPEHVPTDRELKNGAKQGANSWSEKNIGYRGPAPPPGKPHRYFFKVYAVGKMLDLSAGATKDDLMSAMKGHILGQGQLMGKYGR